MVIGSVCDCEQIEEKQRSLIGIDWQVNLCMQATRANSSSTHVRVFDDGAGTLVLSNECTQHNDLGLLITS